MTDSKYKYFIRVNFTHGETFSSKNIGHVNVDIVSSLNGFEVSHKSYGFNTVNKKGEAYSQDGLNLENLDNVDRINKGNSYSTDLVEISEGRFSNVMDYLNQHNEHYNLLSNNCFIFAKELMAAAGLPYFFNSIDNLNVNEDATFGADGRFVLLRSQTIDLTGITVGALKKQHLSKSKFLESQLEDWREYNKLKFWSDAPKDIINYKGSYWLGVWRDDQSGKFISFRESSQKASLDPEVIRNPLLIDELRVVRDRAGAVSGQNLHSRFILIAPALKRAGFHRDGEGRTAGETHPAYQRFLNELMHSGGQQGIWAVKLGEGERSLLRLVTETGGEVIVNGLRLPSMAADEAEKLNAARYPNQPKLGTLVPDQEIYKFKPVRVPSIRDGELVYLKTLEGTVLPPDSAEGKASRHFAISNEALAAQGVTGRDRDFPQDDPRVQEYLAEVLRFPGASGVSAAWVETPEGRRLRFVTPRGEPVLLNGLRLEALSARQVEALGPDALSLKYLPPRTRGMQESRLDKPDGLPTFSQPGMRAGLLGTGDSRFGEMGANLMTASQTPGGLGLGMPSLFGAGLPALSGLMAPLAGPGVGDSRFGPGEVLPLPQMPKLPEWSKLRDMLKLPEWPKLPDLSLIGDSRFGEGAPGFPGGLNLPVFRRAEAKPIDYRDKPPAPPVVVREEKIIIVERPRKEPDIWIDRGISLEDALRQSALPPFLYR